MQKEKDLLWTTEIESHRLSKSIKTSSSVSTSIKLTPEIVALADTKASIYPVLEGFASLDTSLISKELFDFLTSTCKSINEWKLSELKMDDECEFSKVLFKYDVEENWLKINSSKFPIGNEIKLYNRWLFGEPFVTEDDIQVPVRFINKNSSMDLLIYINQKSGYKIEQLVIQKMEKNDGR